MGWFTAAYAGVCVECERAIVPGQQVERRDGGYAHAVCPVEPPKSVETVPWARDHGRIIGVVDLVDVHHFAECIWLRTTWQSADPDDDRVEQAVEKCSRWAEEDEVYHLMLANPRPLAEPIPFKGALGLRRLDPIEEAVVLAGVTS